MGSRASGVATRARAGDGEVRVVHACRYRAGLMRVAPSARAAPSSGPAAAAEAGRILMPCASRRGRLAVRAAADTHRPWERGSNENFNGLLRQYFPKRSSLARLQQRTCDRVAHKLNSRPRKRYGFKSPIERMRELLGAVHFAC